MVAYGWGERGMSGAFNAHRHALNAAALAEPAQLGALTAFAKWRLDAHQLRAPD
jgi:hypothetical protein